MTDVQKGRFWIGSVVKCLPESRRIVRNYEQRLDVSEAMIHVALGSLILRRVVRP